MKLQFDAKQPYQIDAVSAVVDLFDGQPISQPDPKAEKIRCGRKHFEAIGADFDVVISASEI